MKYSALEIAKYIINKCTVDDDAVSNLRLQKVLYYVQKDFLQNGLTAFDDDFEAWQFGPVIPVVYNRYCGYGGMPIRLRYDISLDNNYKDIIDPIITKKRDMNLWTMADDVHRTGKAWDSIYRNGVGDHQIIAKDLIREIG